MRIRRPLAVAIAAAGLAATSLVTASLTVAGPSSAAPAPRLHWKLSKRAASPGGYIRVSFTLHNPPQDGSVVLQRARVGRRYATIEPTLSGYTAGIESTGNATIIAPSIGRYDYRVVVRNARKHAVVVSSPVLVSVYAPIGLAKFLGTTGKYVKVAGTRFYYAASGASGTIASIPTRTCRSVTLVGAYADGAPAGSAGRVELDEAGGGNSFAVTGTQTVAEAHYALTPGTATLVATSNGDPIYVAGSLSCWSSSGS